MQVQAFGHLRDDETTAEPQSLREVTFVASATVLRRIAQHLMQAAAEMERDADFNHLHLQDEWAEWAEGDTDVVVARG